MASQLSHAHRVFLINGMGQIGSRAAQRAAQIYRLHNNHDQVIALVRNSKDLALQSSSIKVIHIPEEQMQNTAFWKDLFFSFQGRQLYFLQTVGIANAESLHRLRAINVETVRASASAFSECVPQLDPGSRYIQLSTLASEIVPDSNYGKTKAEANTVLKTIDIPNRLIMHLGFVMPVLQAKNCSTLTNHRHAFDQWQFSALPWLFRVHPIMGPSGQQLMQPVFIDDVIDAAFGSNFQGQHEVVAAGPEVYSQLSFMQLFAKLRGVKFHCIKVPYDAANLLVKHFPMGHLADYAVEACEKLENNPDAHLYSPQPFEAILGRNATVISDLYKKDASPLMYHTPPIMAYILEVVKTLWNQREARTAMLYFIRNFLWPLSRAFIVPDPVKGFHTIRDDDLAKLGLHIGKLPDEAHDVEVKSYNDYVAVTRKNYAGK